MFFFVVFMHNPVLIYFFRISECCDTDSCIPYHQTPPFRTDFPIFGDSKFLKTVRKQRWYGGTSAGMISACLHSIELLTCFRHPPWRAWQEWSASGNPSPRPLPCWSAGQRRRLICFRPFKGVHFSIEREMKALRGEGEKARVVDLVCPSIGGGTILDTTNLQQNVRVVLVSYIKTQVGA